MEYKVRRIIMTLVVVGIVYLNFVLKVNGFLGNQGLEGFADVKGTAVIILWNVLLMVILMIVGHILLHVIGAIGASVKNEINPETRGQDIDLEELFDDVDDEMDKLINLKSSQVGFIMVGLGFVLGLASILMDYQFGVMLVVMYSSFMLGEVVEAAYKLVMYHRGVIHG